MPNYTLNKPLILAGKTLKPGDKVELRPEQAKRLGESYFKGGLPADNKGDK